MLSEREADASSLMLRRDRVHRHLRAAHSAFRRPLSSNPLLDGPLVVLGRLLGLIGDALSSYGSAWRAHRRWPASARCSLRDVSALRRSPGVGRSGWAADAASAKVAGDRHGACTAESGRNRSGAGDARPYVALGSARDHCRMRRQVPAARVRVVATRNTALPKTSAARHPVSGSAGRRRKKGGGGGTGCADTFNLPLTRAAGTQRRHPRFRAAARLHRALIQFSTLCQRVTVAGSTGRPSRGDCQTGARSPQPARGSG